jgi:hypothetical protein
MRTLKLTIAVLTLSLTSQAQTFNKVVGASGNQQAEKVINTSDGGMLFIGTCDDNGDDVLVIKTDVNGNISWQNRYGTAGQEGGLCVTQIASGDFIIGGYSALDALLLRITSSGSLVDMRTYGDGEPGYSNLFTCVSATSDGGYIALTFRDDGSSGKDVVLMKFSSSHTLLWQKAYTRSGLSHEGGAWIEETSDGGYIMPLVDVGNTIVMKLNSTGAISWMKQYDFGLWDPQPVHVLQNTAGDFIISGDYITSNTAILSISSTGSLNWAKSYNTGLAGQVRTNTFGDYFFCSATAVITRIGTSGSVTWSRSLPGGNTMGGMITSSDGRVAGTGRNSSFGFGGGDFYMFKTHNTGDNCADNAYTATVTTITATTSNASLSASTTSYAINTISGTSAATSFGESSKCGCPVDAGPATVNNQYKPCCATPCTSVLIGTSSSGYNYSWSPTSTLSCPTCAQTNASPCATTTYTLTVTSGSGTCLAATDAITVIPIYQDCCTPKRLAGPGESDENDGEWFEVSPNPSAGKFVLNFHESVEIVDMIRVTDMQGRTIYEKCQVAGYYVEVDLGNQPAGVYLITATFGDKVINRKLTIE